jgi:DNA modification methylase
MTMKTRIETIGDATLYLGDCLEIMPTLGRVDAVVTDPPYIMDPTSRAKSYEGLTSNARETLERKGMHRGFDIGVIFVAAHVVSFCSKKQIKLYIEEAETRGYVWTIITWNKPAPTPLFKRNYLPDTEYIFHMWRGVEVGGTYDTKRKWYVLGAPRHDIGHPTVKPTEIIVNLVVNATGKGGAVLDPFMGSGTTGVACAKLGRKFIGIEIDAEYFDIACKRIALAYAQPSLFNEPSAPKAVQMEFDSTV